MPAHKRKPNYDPKQLTAELITAVCDYFGPLYDDRTRSKNELIKSNKSLREVSEHFGITIIKTRKILITAGYYSTTISRYVAQLRAEGKSIDEIMKITQLSRSSVFSYIPYANIPYNLPDLSIQSERQKQYRVRKRNAKRSNTEIEEKLWEELTYLQGCLFSTCKGLDFTYHIKGGEMFVDRKDKSITKATVMAAYRKAMELGGVVKGPKQLGTFGASYLYPVFLKMGVIKREAADTGKQ